MDDLEFRRQVYAQPANNDQSVLDAAAQDPAKKQFLDELKEFDSKINAAVDVPVPDGLAHKLILRQSLESHKQQKRQNRMHIALAASIAFAVGVSFTFLQSEPYSPHLSVNALNHMYHEIEYTSTADENLDLNAVNAKLASFGGKLRAPFERIYFANYCYFEKNKSLHLVFQEGDTKYTVFVTPRTEDEVFQAEFEDDKYIGKAWQTDEVNVVVLTEKALQPKPAMEKIRDNIYFSI